MSQCGAADPSASLEEMLAGYRRSESRRLRWAFRAIIVPLALALPGQPLVAGLLLIQWIYGDPFRRAFAVFAPALIAAYLLMIYLSVAEPWSSLMSGLLLITCALAIGLLSRLRQERVIKGLCQDLAATRQSVSPAEADFIYCSACILKLGERELDDSKRSGMPLSILLADTGAGPGNGSHGILSVLRQCLRSHDAVGRLGDDRLVVILPFADTDSAHEAAARIQQQAADQGASAQIRVISAGPRTGAFRDLLN